MRSIFFFIKRLLFFIRTHLTQLVIGLVIVLGTVGLLARLLFPELFIARYDVQFTGNKTQERTQAPQAKISWTVEPDQFNDYLVRNFDLPESTPSKTTYYEEGTQRSLTFSQDGTQALYTDPLNKPTVAPQSLELGEQQARTFLRRLGYPENLELVSTSYFASDDFHYDEAPATEANIYAYNFVPRFEDLPVELQNNGNPETLEVYVSGNGVFKASLRQLFLSAEAGENLALKSVDAALQEVSVGNFTSPQLSADALRQGRFTFAEQALIYRFNTSTNLLEPTYRFTGTYTNRNGQTLPVEVFVKAIE